MKDIVVIGSSGHAKVVIDAVCREGRYQIVGLLDRYRSIGEKTSGHRVLGAEDDLPVIASRLGLQGVLIAIGDNAARATVATHVRAICPQLPFVTAIHPRASVGADVVIAEGTVVMAGAVVNTGASVGRFCILNTNCSLDHDSVLDDYASLAPNVATGGRCRIGKGAAIGMGTVIVQGVTVGEHTVIGAASLVMRDVESLVVAYGTPAKKVRARKYGDRYL